MFEERLAVAVEISESTEQSESRRLEVDGRGLLDFTLDGRLLGPCFLMGDLSLWSLLRLIVRGDSGDSGEIACSAGEISGSELRFLFKLPGLFEDGACFLGETSLGQRGALRLIVTLSSLSRSASTGET